jgi:ATP-binding cassette subfamily B protein
VDLALDNVDFVEANALSGMEALYIEAMDELLAKDLAFFQNNYAGSLTKRALGYARRFEDVFDVLSFQVASTVLPLAFVGVVLWAYSPWLIVLLIGMLVATLVMVFPLIRRRRLLVDVGAQRPRRSRRRLNR